MDKAHDLMAELEEVEEMRKISSGQDMTLPDYNNGLPPLPTPPSLAYPMQDFVLDHNEYNIESQIRHKD
jgi:hypothetical protein